MKRVKGTCVHLRHDSHVLWFKSSRDRCPGGKWVPVTEFVDWDAATVAAGGDRALVVRILEAAFGGPE